ncbi:MAG: hypothetical protein JSW61_15005 [Candidatus Thorarchaeota archaeon]|nr:MAG: hypothetical protein JSW61_15005 [Candidatus Thorarchaeota archaeon]
MSGRRAFAYVVAAMISVSLTIGSAMIAAGQEDTRITETLYSEDVWYFTLIDMGDGNYWEERFNITIIPQVSQIRITLQVNSTGGCDVRILDSADDITCSINDEDLWNGVDFGIYSSTWTDIRPGNYSVSILWHQRLSGHLAILVRGKVDSSVLYLSLTNLVIGFAAVAIVALFIVFEIRGKRHAGLSVG